MRQIKFNLDKLKLSSDAYEDIFYCSYEHLGWPSPPTQCTTIIRTNTTTAIEELKDALNSNSWILKKSESRNNKNYYTYKKDRVCIYVENVRTTPQSKNYNLIHAEKKLHL